MKSLVLAAALLLCPCIYLGPVNASTLQQLHHCDVIVLDCQADPEVIKTLHEWGKIVLCYVSVSRLEGNEPWFEPLPSNAILGYDPVKGVTLVDPCNPYVKRLLAKAFRLAVSRGFDGIAVFDVEPSKVSCIEEILKAFRSRHPSAKIMVVGGINVLEELAPYVNYIVYDRFSDVNARERLSRDVRVLRSIEMLYGVNIMLLARLSVWNETHVKAIESVWRNLAPQWPLYIAPNGFKELGLCPGVVKESLTSVAEHREVRVNIDEIILLAYMLLALTIVVVAILMVKALRRA